jgi:hypothetical protein
MINLVKELQKEIKNPKIEKVRKYKYKFKKF